VVFVAGKGRQQQKMKPAMEKIIYQPPKGHLPDREMFEIAFATYKRLVLKVWKWLKKVFDNGTHRSSLIAHH
jgi:hypothetical protein